ncbi:hypothetical protein WR25_26362 isoform A [Diploscapter pachys]|uniref:Choline/carnitine acyltransferase domain-containing protein n=1 Tax=Diploscapter pachys TaxID=2018661 RepID=A0A2A2JJV1_9BILA|nr:hypothetical protein WR25_26362 isoform A [Diploscapter pachys]
MKLLGEATYNQRDSWRWYLFRAVLWKRSFADTIFPVLIHEFVALIGIVIGLNIYKIGPTSRANYVSAFLTATFVISMSILLLRFSLILLFYYRGFLFEEIGKPISLPTKIFLMICEAIKSRARSFSYQKLLPWQPVPNLSTTIKKYLETVRPILDDEKYSEIELQAKEFEHGAGQTLQWKLWMKWMISSNYVSDLWKKVVYLRERDSLIVSNVGCGDLIYSQATTNQAARAACVTLLKMNYIRDVFVKDCLKPVMMGAPLCNSQLVDFNRTLRVPQKDCDVTIKLPQTYHIAVYHKGCWYKIVVHNGKRLIRPAELERALQLIIDADNRPDSGERLLSSLTAGPRELWAKIRNEKLADGLNKESLWAIESSLEIVFLDDQETGYDPNDPSAFAKEVALALHGDGYQMWCDKPSVYMFTKNGRFLSQAEHSVADAMVLVQIREYIKYHEAYLKPYDQDGHCVGEIEFLPKPERLHWELDSETKTAIDHAYRIAKSVGDNLENTILVWEDYGKDFIKKSRVSPDAYCQMAIQLTYFKDQGKFDLTYEPAVLRLYKDGRTETVRSCSTKSCDFVRAMMDQKSDVSFDDEAERSLILN